jgi:hypothetical protein
MLTITTVAMLALAQGSAFKGEPQYEEPLSAETLDAEAVFVASIVTTELRAPKELIVEVRQVLARVRKESPEVAMLPVMRTHDPTSMLLQVSPELDARLKAHEGDLAAFDFKDKTLNALRDLIPIESFKDFGSFWVLRLKEKNPGVNMVLLRRELMRSTAASSVSRNLTMGDDNELRVIKRDDRWLVMFKKGWGDCPAGCIYNAFWYFEVTKDKVELVERDHPKDHPAKELYRPRVHRWGFPSRVVVSVYPTFEDLMKTARGHADWWHRAHALESAAQLLYRDRITFGEDNAALYATLRKSALERREEVLDLLIDTLGGKDAQLREAAEFSLESIFQEEHGQDVKAWTELRKTKK